MSEFIFGLYEMKNRMHIELLKFTFFFGLLLISWIGTLSN